MANIDNSLIHYALKSLAPENKEDGDIVEALFLYGQTANRWLEKVGKENRAVWPQHAAWYKNAEVKLFSKNEEDIEKCAEKQAFPKRNARATKLPNSTSNSRECAKQRDKDKKKLQYTREYARGSGPLQYSFESHLLNVFNNYIQTYCAGNERYALERIYEACEKYRVSKAKLEILSKKTTIQDVVEYFCLEAKKESSKKAQTQRTILKNNGIDPEKGISDFVLGKTAIKNTLAPIRDSYWINEYKEEAFFGRKTLIQAFEEWKAKKTGFDSNKVLLIKGNLGAGKTALMVHLEQSKRINTVFYCRRHLSDTASSKKLIFFITDYLLENVPEYVAYWEEAPFPDDIEAQSTENLINALLSNPLYSIESEQDVIIGVDALDEAAHSKENQIKDVLSKLFELTPPWLRFVVTGRYTTDIQTLIGKNRIWDIQKDTEQGADMKLYLKSRLAPLEPKDEEIDVLASKVDGNYLYAKIICNELLDGIRLLDDLDTFPVGMTGIYTECIDRLVGTGLNYSVCLKPALEILAASYDPVSTELLGKMEYSYLDSICAAIELFPQSNGVILPIHSSVFEWLASPSAGDYCIYTINGHRKLADYFEEHMQEAYALKHLTAHALETGDLNIARQLMQNADFQKNRVDKFGTEMIRAYLLELKQLSVKNSALAYEVMTSACFRELILGEYRKVCFECGYFFILSESKFDDVLEKKTEFWGYRAEAGIAYYKYAVKTFHEAMPILASLLSSDDVNLMSINEKAELSNMYALCLLKNSDYTVSSKKYRAVLESRPNCLHQAEAHMNLGKLACYQLEDDWQNRAKQSFDTAVSDLEDELYINPSQALSMKLAEYRRISALYAGIWGGDLDYAEKSLEQAKRVYDETPGRARYHARYLYTNAALKIFRFEFDAALKELSDLQNSTTEIIKDYERAQIAFFTAVVHIMKGDMKTARIELIKALRYAEAICSWVEYEEARTLLAEITEKQFGAKDTSTLPGIAHIKTWCKHVADVINRLKAANDSK